MAGLTFRAADRARSARGRGVPFSLVVLRYFAYVTVVVALVWAASFAAFSASIDAGLVYPASYGPAHVNEVAERVRALGHFSADAVPTAYRYALFDASGAVLESTMPEGRVEEVRAAALGAASTGEVSQDGVGLGVTFATFGVGDGTTCALMCEYLPQFVSPELASTLPNPQNLLLLAGCAGSVLAVALVARRASRVLTRALEPLVEVADRVGAQELDFSVGTSRIRQVSDVLDAMDAMRASLAESLEARWRAEREQREQVASLAHDLKTPLTVLRANADFVAEELVGAGETDELDAGMRRELAAAARDIAGGAERLDGYVRLLVEASRGEGGATRSLVAPGELCERVVDGAGTVCRARGVALGTQVDPAVASAPKTMLDLAALSRATENLVSNAAEHARTQVGVSCSFSDGALVIEVTDDGPGFSPAALEHGCERLFVDDSSRTGRGGERHYGIGLFVAAEAARAHGGTLTLANRAGAVATLTIPLA